MRSPSQKPPRPNIYETITAKLLAAIEASPGDPIMPWQRGGTCPVLPTNAVTGQAYRGVNILSLWVTTLERGYASGEWATLRQWNEQGATVRKGEKASPIVFYKEITVEAEPETDNGEGRTMAKRRTRSGDRSADGASRNDRCRGRPVRRPLGWPRYMKERRLADGSIGYYWYPHPRDLVAGFTTRCEPLGRDYASAIDRARMLNAQLDAWRGGRGKAKDLNLNARFGTLTWLFEQYRRSSAFDRVSERSRPEYLRALCRIEDLPTSDGRRVGELAVASISARAADKIYVALQNGPRGKRVRQANLSIDIARRAWDIVRRLYPKVVPTENPFRGVLKIGGKKTKVAASRDEAYALASALKEIGEPHLGAAALICFEWLQRPENVLTGKITWGDYRPQQHARHVRILHHKTGEVVMLPLEDNGQLLYPELEVYLKDLPRLGTLIVATKGSRGPPRPYAMVYAQAKVREARTKAGLGAHVTLDACRHGGMTELGDAELAEQSVMALSGHRTPQAARLYVKRTEKQRLAASRKRRVWLEQQRQPGQQVEK